MGKFLPKYPIYIPSKGRFGFGQTMKALDRDSVPYRIVVEDHEADAYGSAFGADKILVLPFQNPGSVIPARNWIKDHSIAEGHAKHWQLDDNILFFFRRYKARRIHCDAGYALRVVEDLTDRYENVAISGMNYAMFAPDYQKMAAFYVNVHVYSCSLINNAIPHRWRGRYNEDTDICLQALSDGWCTILTNAFLAQKIWTMQIPGGNTAALYQGDGRLRMAKALERMWPGVVETKRRFKRPQHVVKDAWRGFTTPLRLKPDVDLSQLKADEYGVDLVKKKEIRSDAVRSIFNGWSTSRPRGDDIP